MKLELLSPAKDLECGIAAINFGADAIYIGAPKFGARVSAGNSIHDIEKLIEYAHKYWAKVYVTVNTLIYENELKEVEKLIHSLYGIGTDAIIFQDMALFEMDLPPIPLFASTQTHNYELNRIKFLESLGIQRIILARELSLPQLKKIRENTKLELEFFVHGALCVSFSGQCYMSQATTGRSANRGECSQSCRMLYTLEDANGNFIANEKHLLSLKDLNLSDNIRDLIDAGISSFKIEGRLKDINYVKNVTAHYRKKIDDVLSGSNECSKSSSGKSYFNFIPEPSKSFNRGFTSYFFDGNRNKIASINSPKSIGKKIGKVIKVTNEYVEVDTKETILNGDGICFFNREDVLSGTLVNKVEKNKIFTNELRGIHKGAVLYRNYDHAFNKLLDKEKGNRRIAVDIDISYDIDRLKVFLIDCDENKAILEFKIDSNPAKDIKKAADIFERQFKKSGDSIFEVNNIRINLEQIQFIPISKVNEIRREAFARLEKERLKNIPISKRILERSRASIDKKLNFKANVVNSMSRDLYKKHGAENIENGFELLNNYKNFEVMRMKYCVKEELNICPKHGGGNLKIAEPLYIKDSKHKYRLVFDCKLCEMGVILE